MNIREKAEEENGGALCSHYGSLDNSVKPKYGVHYMILDEYMTRTMESLSDKVKDELNRINRLFKKSLEDEITSSKNYNEKLSFQVKELSRQLKDIVEINKLIVPKKPEIKVKRGNAE